MRSPAPARGSAKKAEIGENLMAVLRRISGTSPLDIMNVRKIVEPQAAEVAATQASEAALATIREAHEAAQKAVHMDAFERWDAEFHKRIFVSTRNEFLTNLDEMVRVIRSQPPWTELKRRSFNNDRRLLYCREHDCILLALEQRDAHRAAQAMRAHLETVAKNLFGTRH